MSILEMQGSAAGIARPQARKDRPLLDRSKLRALVLLGGGLRPSSFLTAIGRSPLDLPVDAHHSVMDLWRAHGAILTAHARVERMAVRVITNGVRPASRPQAKSLNITIESDPYEFRGPGGVLRDVAEAYEDDDILAVATANQILLESLPHLLGSLESIGGDVSMLAHDDGTPAGLMLARCGAIRAIPGIGYVDLKEQALPIIARNAAVKVLNRPDRAALPLRTATDYLAALREYHLRFTGKPNTPSRFAEDWSSAFSLCEHGSRVHETARIHDSVVLRGAKVERGALVARSVVCPGAIVPAGRVIIDQVVTATLSGRRAW